MRVRQSTTGDEKLPCVLVVDDEANVCDLLARWLRDAGYACHCASGVEQACRILAQGHVDVVMTDIHMPDELGIDWLRRLRNAYTDLAIVVLTGSNDARIAAEAFNNGAWGYLIKPISKDELLLQISRALEYRDVRSAEIDYTRSLERRLHEMDRLVQAAHAETLERLRLASLVRSDECGVHLQRIGAMSAVLAAALHCTPEEIDAIRLAAPLHDIGKLGVPEHGGCTLHQQTVEEQNAFQAHAIIGAGILTGSRLAALQMAEQIARSHHEHWDGTGYPDGLVGEAIPLPARIVAVVDAYDDLTHDRPGRKALAESAALACLEQGVGSTFDPSVVRAFRRVESQVRRALAQLDNGISAWAAIGQLPTTPDRAEFASFVPQ